MKILPPLPERHDRESYETVPEYPEDGSLISSNETEKLRTVPDTTRSAGGDSSLPPPIGVGDGLKLPLKAGGVPGSSVSAKERSWNIESVAMGDGIVDGNGKCMEKGLMYGCAGLSRSVESFNPIVWESLHLKGYGNRCIDLKTRFVIKRGGQTPLKLQIPSMRTTRRDVSFKRKRYIREAVLGYCRKHPEVAVNIGGPGARGTSRKMYIHLLKQQGPIYSNYTQGEGDCMRVSIANAVGVLLGPEFVTECEKKMRRIVTVCDSLKSVGTLVEFSEGLSYEDVTL